MMEFKLVNLDQFEHDSDKRYINITYTELLTNGAFRISLREL